MKLKMILLLLLHVQYSVVVCYSDLMRMIDMVLTGIGISAITMII